ncbi:hypothetical protein [Tahibacter caeni]|uniref:hypothetical protein n=1 Tax=Tahibacter caeni TaxID=1453545 RepID=UPI0021488960|nr:hypothetical protein [Tahibacter caeni]
MKTKIYLLIFLVSIAGCAATGSKKSELMGMDEFDRTNSCVRGGLPMEIVFSVADNPPRLAGEYITSEDLDKLVSKMDGKLRFLLGSSIRKAVQDVGARKSGHLKVDQYFELLSGELSNSIAENGPRTFGIEFCGAMNSVSNAVSASIASYFERALLSENGDYAEWASRVAGKGRESSLLLVMAALRAENIAFESAAMNDRLTDGGKP